MQAAHLRLQLLRCPRREALCRTLTSFHDPVRAVQLLNSPADQLVYVLAPAANQHQDSSSPQEPPAAVQNADDVDHDDGSCEESARALLLQLVRPGRPSFSLFVQEGDDKLDLVRTTLKLMLSELPGVAEMARERLSFSAIPPFAVPMLHEVLGPQGAGLVTMYGRIKQRKPPMAFCDRGQCTRV